MIALLFLVPIASAMLALIVRRDVARRAILLGTAIAHAAIVALAWAHRPIAIWDGQLALDDAGLLFITLTSVVFLATAIYAVGYLMGEQQQQRHRDLQDGTVFGNGPEAGFIACLLFFLATMSLMAESQNFGVLWVALEASTLASAPLIYFHRHHRSLEAAWKYLVICSVGIAMALLGNFCLAIAASAHAGGGSLEFSQLIVQARSIDPRWLKAAFLCFLVGFGTKMGLAPLHTWLPDAHAESPSLVSALLSGALLNCAFLGILRAYQVCLAAGLGSFCQSLLLGFGLLSMIVAAIYILDQADYKRMLAYSSVEHMGLLALGVGLGGSGVFGALLHAVNHSLAKAMLFLVAGHILALYKTRTSAQVQGLLGRDPKVGILWVAGFLAITGFPPFGTFLSEFTIVKRAIDAGQIAVAVAVLASLGVVFLGFATSVLSMTQGAADLAQPPSPGDAAAARSRATIGWLTLAPPALLGTAVLVLGLYLPSGLLTLLHSAASTLGGS